MLYSEKIDGQNYPYVPDAMPPEWWLEVCDCGNWKCWMCAGSGMRWMKSWRWRDSIPPTFKTWHTLTKDQKKAQSSALWQLVDGWWTATVAVPAGEFRRWR
jgi:hypothetical protein